MSLANSSANFSVRMWLYDHSVAILCIVVAFLVSTGLLLLTHVPISALILAQACIAICLIGIGCARFVHARNMYRRIDLIRTLDHSYLGYELLTHPANFETRIIYQSIEHALRDMTRHVAQAQNETMQYQEYLETWIHEIKTPLAAACVALDQQPTANLEHLGLYLERIESLVNQVMHYARSNDVAKDYHIQATCLETVVQKALKRNAHMLIDAHCSLTLDNLKQTVYTDPASLGFIVDQALINAVNYRNHTRNLTLNLYAQTESSQPDARTIRFCICDNGLGCEQHDIARVFDKGFTGENVRQTHNSSGMGLFICKRIATKLGIHISACSAHDQGFCLQLLIPVDEYFFQTS